MMRLCADCAVTEAPVIVSITDDTGDSNSDAVTYDTTLTLAGTAEDNATITLYKGGNLLATTSANGSGNWSYPVTLTEGTYSFTATATSNDQTSDFSYPFVVTVDVTDPTLTLSVPAETYSLSPEATVSASDNFGFADDATVTIDVDLDGDHDFEGGELNYANGILFEGSAVIELAGLSIDTYDVRARITDLAGNDGTSSVQVMDIVAVPDPWDTDNDDVITVDSSGDPLQMMGGLRLAHALDLDISPGTSQSGSPMLVYNSHLTDVRPVIQISLQLPNQTSLPSSFDATLTFDSVEQDPITFYTSEVAQGDLVTLAVQVDAPVTATGRYAWSLVLDVPGEDPILADGVVFIRAEDASPFVAGWTLSILNRLVEISSDGNGPAGVMWLYGDGTTRFFADATGVHTPNPPKSTANS